MFEYRILEYPPSKLNCRISHSLLKCSFYKPIWMGNLLILFSAVHPTQHQTSLLLTKFYSDKTFDLTYLWSQVVVGWCLSCHGILWGPAGETGLKRAAGAGWWSCTKQVIHKSCKLAFRCICCFPPTYPDWRDIFIHFIHSYLNASIQYEMYQKLYTNSQIC